MSSSNPSSSLANSIKKPVSRPPVSSPTDVKKVSRPDGSSRPLTSSGKSVTPSGKSLTSSAGRTVTPASRPESKLPSKAKDEQGLKGKPTVGTSSASRPEKTKQPLQGVKKEQPGSRGKEVVRSAEVKNKAPPSTSKTDTKSTKTTKKPGTRGKTEKKVYSLPGQKHDPPEEREPLRIFYESLSKQIPTSEMAEFWMMEYGLLSPEKAKKTYEKKQKRQRTGPPVKSAVKFDRPESSKKTQSVNNGDMKSKKRVNYSDDDDDDNFIVKSKKFKL